ncbi:MAG: relaxase domain-containing protein [Actinobacteria bacterium]|nr:relaxase domain-containing protein [Actinomycetota bacterium]
MLSIGKLGTGQESYYLEKVAEGAEDYYSGEGEAEGYWVGSLPTLLGLDGKVEGEQLTAMLTGTNPATGEPLGLRAVGGRGPVPGFDLTFSAPKSVSLTWALGGGGVGAEVAAAHKASVEAALGYLERSATFTRRGGQAEFVPGRGLLAAAHPHRSSRAGDPQLHTHVLVANATMGPDGRWTRLHHPSLYEHAKTAGYLYEAHLRDELTRRLRVRWREVTNGIAEIEGFHPEELRAFSTRRAEILAAAGEGASAREMQIATLTTRRAKARDLTTESMREAWRVKGSELGLTREAIAARLGHEPPGRTVLTTDRIGRSATANVSHFDRRQAIRAVADNLPHGASVAEVEELAGAFLASSEVLRIADMPRGPRFTTRRIWRLEQEALTTAAEMHVVSGCAEIAPVIVARVLADHPSLKDDQRALVERLLAGGRGLEVVIGEAGSGKTYATVAAAAGWAAVGDELVVAAPTWRAANVLRAEGLDAGTVAGLLARLDARAEEGLDPLSPHSVLLIDEAGMVDSASLARLIDQADRSDAKLVLVGDPAQLGEIEAGGLFAAIAGRSEVIHLDEVIRHRHDLDREAAKLIREGRGAEAVDRYVREGRMVIAADTEARRQAIVADWWEARKAGEDALMIARANSERAHLNERARELRRLEGRLGSEEIEVGGRRFAAGEEVITRVNDRKAQVYNRERWTVESVDAEKGRMTLAGIDTQRRVDVDPDYLGRTNPADGAPAIEPGYAATIYQAQGATLDSAFVMADPGMDRRDFYVAASRTRGETFFYATPEVGFDRVEYAPAEPPAEGLEHITRAAERDGAQAAAHDAALREQVTRLSTPELFARRHEIAAEAHAEAAAERGREDLARDLAAARRAVEKAAAREERLGEEPPFWSRGARTAWRRESEARAEAARHAEERRRQGETEFARAAEVGQAARAEQAAIDRAIEGRTSARMATLRRDPPGYLVAQLGERPTDPGRRQTWEEAARGIEGWRMEHGVTDRDSALGPRPAEGWARREHGRADQAIHRARRELGLEQVRARERAIEMGPEL